MEYSKMTSIEIFNFMSYKHAIAYFDEKNILNFKGYNNSGKSAFLEACAVCLMNKYSRSQSKFIHHGEEYFRILISFDDGVVILRDKYYNGQSLYEMYKDGQLIFTTKQGSQLSKVDDVPQKIKDYLGLIEFDNGYLNFQTRKEPLFLVDTKGSENYYNLHEALKAEEIARANALINSDRNELNSSIVDIEQELNHDRLLLNEYGSIQESLVVKLSEKEVHVQNLLAKQSAAEHLKSLLDSIAGIKSIPDIEIIDFRNMKSLLSLQSILSEIGNGVKYPDMVKIPLKQLSAIAGINDKMYQLNNLDTSLEPIELAKVDISSYKSLSILYSLVKQLSEIEDNLGKLQSKETSLDREKIGLLTEAKEQGIRFVECENCGSLVEVKE